MDFKPKKNSKDRIVVPRIAGKSAKILEETSVRKALPQNIEAFNTKRSRVTTQDADEVLCLAYSLIMSTNILRQAGTILPFYKLEQMTERILALLGPQDIMRLEVEAYETLQWLHEAFDAAHDTPEEGNVCDSDETVETILCALSEGRDLKMDYYTYSRGEFTTRRVTPIRLDAEKFLFAYCHIRHTERYFRISRVANLEVIKPPVYRGQPEHEMSSAYLERELEVEESRSLPAQQEATLFDSMREEKIEAPSKPKAKKKAKARTENEADTESGVQKKLF